MEISKKSSDKLTVKQMYELTRSPEIQNVSDNMRETKFTGLPTSVSSIVIDNENEVITCNEIQNPYQYFNFNSFRLVHGSNHIILTGNGTVKITCEFPMRIGG